MKPELGKPSSAKHTCNPGTYVPIVVRLIFALSPTLIVTAEGSVLRLRFDALTFEDGSAAKLGNE